MNRNKYTKWFEEFWARLQEARKIGPMRSLGGKGEAYQQCKTKKVVADDVDYLVNQYIKQRDGIIESWSRGGKPAPLKDICRWIKYERFDDEPCESSIGKLTLDERIDQAGRDYLRERGVDQRGLHGETVEGDYETEISSSDAGQRRIQNVGGGL